jgi:hypothetical protein
VERLKQRFAEWRENLARWHEEREKQQKVLPKPEINQPSVSVPDSKQDTVKPNIIDHQRENITAPEALVPLPQEPYKAAEKKPNPLPELDEEDDDREYVMPSSATFWKVR